MKTKLTLNVSVKKSLIHGYGVFAERDLIKDDIIEECHTVITKNNPTNELNNYVFAANEYFVIPLGFGCIYNHSDNPNAGYSFDLNRQIMTFKTKRFIGKGEEILISYGNDWFSSRSLSKKEISKLNFRYLWRFFLGMPLRGLTVIILVYSLTHWIARFV